MSELLPYLSFSGNAREALEFYRAVFGGTLQMQTVGESPAAGNMPPEAKDQILHAALMVEGKVFLMGSDMFDENDPQGNRASLCLICKSKEEIESLYSKLSEGGNPQHPLKEEFFGTYGDLTDKYGYRWMLQFGMSN